MANMAVVARWRAHQNLGGPLEQLKLALGLVPARPFESSEEGEPGWRMGTPERALAQHYTWSQEEKRGPWYCTRVN